MRSLSLLPLFAALAPLAHAQDDRIGFLEEFVMAEDRAKVLEQLVPGTVEAYYFTCLERQQAGDLDAVERTLRTWLQRHPRGEQMIEIEHRQALLAAGTDPDTTYDYLVRQLGLRFDHERQIPDAEAQLPSVLDPNLIAVDSLTRRAFELHRDRLQGFSNSMMRALASQKLTNRQLHELLERLERPDLARLPELVVRDLGTIHSKGFGSLDIHRRLLLDQLDACAVLDPALLNVDAFREAYVARLAPGPDVQWREDAQAREDYLERLLVFANRLDPVHNTFKAHVLHHYLVHDLAQGTPSRERFLAWIRLPRTANWCNPEHAKRFAGEQVIHGGGQHPTQLGAVGSEEQLLRDYLEHFFASESTYASFAPFVRDELLTRVFAETKILLGLGDMERWYSLLDDPAAYEALRRRVEIRFAKTQPTRYGVADEVRLDVDLKNVDTLLVKVFEIDAFGYYRATGQEVAANIPLDGLVAGQETTYTYEESPLRRVRRSFAFPEIDRPGVYVIELIGGGTSSRAIIHKGRLQLRERSSAAGHAFQVFDETGAMQPGASLWFGARAYEADENGEIFVPFTSEPGTREVILTAGERCSLEDFVHQSERYQLEAGMLCDREALLAGNEATLLVRPQLSLGGEPISLTLLEDALLEVTATRADGVVSKLEVRDVELRSDREWVQSVRVPSGAVRLAARLTGRIERIDGEGHTDLTSGTEFFDLNGMDHSAATHSHLLGRDASGWFVEVRGKNGELRPGTVVDLELQHRDFRDAVSVQMRSNADGRVALGELAGIDRVSCLNLPDGSRTWELARASRRYPGKLNAAAGDVIQLPAPSGLVRLQRSDVSLLELIGDSYTHDRFAHVRLEDGVLALHGLPAGDYELYLSGAKATIDVRVTDGVRHGDWIHGRDRWLESTPGSLLRLGQPLVDGDHLVVPVPGAGEGTRVHVVANRYHAPYDAVSRLRVSDQSWNLGAEWVDQANSAYFSGRAISDEYRYVLERRFTETYPGNMLERPGLLLNPWAVDIWNSVIGIGGGAGGAYGGRFGGRRNMKAAGGAAGGAGSSGDHPSAYANLDFLPTASRWVTNLRPGKDGMLRVPLSALGDGQHVQVVAVDRDEVVRAEAALPWRAFTPKDQRLAAGFDAQRHLIQRRAIDFLNTGESAELAQEDAGQVEIYDTFEDVYGFYRSQDWQDELGSFSFLLEWSSLDQATKQEHYGKRACHELNLFLARKDPAFFDAVVRPFLASKVHREFLDDYLLEEDLTGYLEPWAFSQLNVAEQILLAQRLPAAGAAVERRLREHLELYPTDLDTHAAFFSTALAGDLDADADGIEFDRFAAAADRRPTSEDAAHLEPMESAKAEAKNEEEMELGELSEEEPALANLEKQGLSDAKKRKSVQQLHQPLEDTRRYVESRYWGRTQRDAGQGMIPVHEFWLDLAAHESGTPFLSSNFFLASGHVNEMLLALALLDVPFEAGQHDSEVEGDRMRLTAASPLLFLRRELTDAALTDGQSGVLVAQDLFRMDDRFAMVDGQRVERPVTGALVAGEAYVCRVVVTNPTLKSHELELLLQIPAGSIPPQSGQRTQSVPMWIDAYGTASVEYAFYFPAPGEFAHYPVHAGEQGELIASARPRALTVARVLEEVDTTSWEHVSQSGTNEQVLAFLDDTNLLGLDLDRVLWRLDDRDFYRRLTAKLRDQMHYQDSVWSYALHHQDAQGAGEYLRHATNFLASCGPALRSPMLDIDPVEREWYEHVEFRPIVNARSHPFGGQREITNGGVREQYQELLDILAHQADASDIDELGLVYYLLLQDRIGDALRTFARVDPEQLPGRVQYDYMRAYLDFFSDEHAIARGIAEAYVDYPVPHWRGKFQEVLSHLDEAEGRGSDPSGGSDAGADPVLAEASLELAVDHGRATLRHDGLAECEVRYYAMDVEFLFSTSPFVQQGAGSFAYVKPNRIDRIELSQGDGPNGGTVQFQLPSEFARENVLVEVRGGGLVRREAHYANALAVQLIETRGQLKVAHADTGDPLQEVYVKVYARDGDRVSFHKDGYTDLRGRFDYVSVSGSNGIGVDRYAILVMSPDAGAVIREVEPPAR